MVYKFDPIYFNGTIFDLDEETWEMSGDWMGYRGRNEPIPASCFPQTLTFEAASDALPDMFHTARDIVMFSERARLVMEQRAPGQVEFIPVDVDAPPRSLLVCTLPTHTTSSTFWAVRSDCNGSKCRTGSFPRKGTVSSGLVLSPVSVLGSCARQRPGSR